MAIGETFGADVDVDDSVGFWGDLGVVWGKDWMPIDVCFDFVFVAFMPEVARCHLEHLGK